MNVCGRIANRMQTRKKKKTTQSHGLNGSRKKAEKGEQNDSGSGGSTLKSLPGRVAQDKTIIKCNRAGFVAVFAEIAMFWGRRDFSLFNDFVWVFIEQLLTVEQHHHNTILQDFTISIREKMHKY